MLKRREPPALDIFLEHHTRQGEDTMISILHVIEDIEKKEKKSMQSGCKSTCLQPLTVLKFRTTFCITVFKTHMISRKKVGPTFKTVRGCKHVDLQSGCTEFF
jgi:hypothetical protein